jgi:ACS family glucarate transporter-like MFS transporter
LLAGMSGMAFAGAAITAGAFADSAVVAIASLSAGAGCLYFAVGAYWASTSDLSKTHAGALSGLMNTGANLGGAISPTLTPWMAEQWGWPTALAAAGAVALVGAILWLKIDPAQNLDR